MTGKKKWPGGALSVLIVAELGLGIYSVVRVAMGSRKSLPFVCLRAGSLASSAIVATEKSRRVQDLPLSGMATRGASLY